MLNPSSRHGARVGVAIALACALGPASATRAQTDAQKAAAQALFDEARRLMSEGEHEKACPKLEESQRLDPGVGTKFNLAACYEATGRTASAWSLFLEVAAEAHKAAERAREDVARKRASALEPKLSKLRIVVPRSVRVDGLTISRGQITVGSAQWGQPMPADPGTHEIRARAPGKHPWTAEVEVAPDGETYTLTLRPLEDAPEPVDPEQDTRPFFERLGTQRTVALGVGAAGVIALGTGSVFGLLALGDDEASEADCEANRCNAEGLAARNDAREKGDIATIAFAAGGALVAGAAVLYLTASDEEEPGAGIAVSPAIGIGQAAITVGGSF